MAALWQDTAARKRWIFAFTILTIHQGALFMSSDMNGMRNEDRWKIRTRLSHMLFVPSSVQATIELQRRIAILGTVTNQRLIFFCFPWHISSGVQKKTTYLADISEAVPISLCGNKDPPQLWVHPEWQPWSHPQRLRQLRASSACHLTGTRKRNSGWHREHENNNKPTQQKLSSPRESRIEYWEDSAATVSGFLGPINCRTGDNS